MIDVTLTVLIENTAPDGLIAEHGLSLLIETRRTKFVFDCGHTGAAFDNAKTLGVDLSDVRLVALSHSHYDHAGGLPKLLDAAAIETVCTGENFWAEKFSRDGDGFRYSGCGFDEKFLAAHHVEQRICRDVMKIDAEAWLVGNFRRRFEFETIPTKFVRGAEKIPDDFSDEIALVLRGRDGLTVVTACAHSGIANIVADVRERFNLPVASVIGGLHLVNATDDRIARTIAALKNFGAKKILPCHCSGDEFMKNFPRLTTGSVVEIF